MNKFSPFFNESMQAKNIVEIDVDRSAMSAFQELINYPFNKDDYCITSPSWNSDIKWISANNSKTHQFFYDHFSKMKIASSVLKVLDLNESPTLYQGFIVQRSNCTKTNFHEDWINTKNQAFTFMTPITDNSDGFGLLYYDIYGQVREYNYQVGKGILFGDKFIHSTKPGRSEHPVMILCFTFGTDKMRYWNSICLTAGYQGGMIQMPNKQWMPRGGWGLLYRAIIAPKQIFTLITRGLLYRASMELKRISYNLRSNLKEK